MGTCSAFGPLSGPRLLDARCWLAVLAALGQLRKKYRIEEEERVETGMFSGEINSRRGPDDTSPS